MSVDRRRRFAGIGVAVVVLSLLLIAPSVAVVEGGAGGSTAQSPTSVTALQESNETVDDSDDRRIETTYATIMYHEEYREEAASVADVVDEHYLVIHQTFSIHPPENEVSIVVGPRETFPCDAVGCVDPLGRVYLSTDDRSLLHHELVHVAQVRNHWSPTSLVRDPDTGEGAIIEGTAKYLDSAPSSIGRSARFDPDRIQLTPYPETSEDYANQALFAEFVLHEYGRGAFDAMVLDGDVDALEAETGTPYAELESQFYDDLDEQRARLRSGGPIHPAFTYEPFVATPGDAVTLDARTPDAVSALDRTWYPTEPDGYAWDLTGDGEIDATGPEITHEFETAGTNDVTLIVTVDGEEYATTQRLLVTDDLDGDGFPVAGDTDGTNWTDEDVDDDGEQRHETGDERSTGSGGDDRGTENDSANDSTGNDGSGDPTGDAGADEVDALSGFGPVAAVLAIAVVLLIGRRSGRYP